MYYGNLSNFWVPNLATLLHTEGTANQEAAVAISAAEMTATEEGEGQGQEEEATARADSRRRVTKGRTWATRATRRAATPVRTCQDRTTRAW